MTYFCQEVWWKEWKTCTYQRLFCSQGDIWLQEFHFLESINNLRWGISSSSIILFLSMFIILVGGVVFDCWCIGSKNMILHKIFIEITCKYEKWGQEAPKMRKSIARVSKNDPKGTQSEPKNTKSEPKGAKGNQKGTKRSQTGAKRQKRAKWWPNST